VATFIVLLILIPLGVWADTARDNVVNSGNAVHLGAVDTPDAIVNATAAVDAEDTVDDAIAPACFLNEALCECLSEACPGCDCASGEMGFFGPIGILNQHPPSLIFLSPVPEAATVMSPGQKSLKLRLDWTNNIIRELDSGTIVDYDFETLRAEAAWYAALGRRGELSVRIPLIYRSHGILDGVISDWHNAFGLLNGMRDDFPDNMYRYTITSRDGLVYNGEGDSLGIGDLSVAYKHPLWNRREGQDAAAVRLAVKAPLGDPDAANGSGNWDAQIGVLYQRQLGRRFRGYTNVDWVMVGEPDWENIAHQDVLATLLALEYAWNDDTSLVVQYATERNALRTGSYEADKDSQTLTFGFHHRTADGMVWSGGFAEDINPETAPYFIMLCHFGWDL